MHYYSLNQAMKERFGCKVYKLALDGGMTCPNRDGTIGERGCIFCSDVGSGEFASPACGNISRQIAQAKARVEKKNKGGKYVAYFQSFTNTYGPLPYLERIFREAMEPEDIVALSVATRPDCLGPEVIDLLAQLNTCKPVWVELGLQTIHPASARYIRRGYDLEVYDWAVRVLKEADLEVITHVILGLPGESREQMAETVRYVGQSGVDGIKLQLLHVLEGTDLAQDWREGKVPVMELEDYVRLLEDCLAVLPPDMVIHRLTGDGYKRDLLAPLWTGDKKRVLNTINQTFARDGVCQGSQL
ncbi:MAG: TIGR01212 family radical SAM protein [Ruminiclostridium sp.]|nr:TIGR01212 family radical SAM protein [Ruminiclostridium sp.]MBQ9933051.1 TIGR01212 family radical SAM protein [Ruminiclostridium sp.]